jgi:hypothetical protein
MESVVQATIELPKAFSVSHAPEFRFVQDLVTRLNPKLLVAQVATGVHVNGGSTVNWGLVYLDDQPPTHKEVHAALKQAGLDFQHNAEIQASRVWVNNQSDAIEKAPS